MKKAGFYGWKLLAAFWFIYLVNLGYPTYGSSVVNAYMATSLHLDRAMLGLAFSVYMLMVGLPGPLVAVIVNRIGVRWTLLIGSCSAMAGGLALALFVHTGWQAVIAFGVLIGFGSCAGGAIAEQAAIAQWFVRRRALALSLMYSGGGVGGFLLPPLLNRLIAGTHGNWRMAWWAFLGVGAIAALITLFFVKERPSDLGQLPDGGEVPAGESRGKRVWVTNEEWTFQEAMRSRALILMLLSSIGISCGFTLIQGHGVVHLKDLGHSPAEAAMAMSILAISTLAGKLLASFGDRIEPRYVWAVAMTAFGLGMILVVHATSSLDLYPFPMLLGFGWGAALVCMMGAPMNYFGLKAYPAVIGVWLAIQTGIGSLAPFVAGYVFDKTGSYAPSFYCIAALCFAGSLLLLMATPPRRKLADELPAALGQQVAGA
ncbi:MAG TPA: MFS transporter [Bryobacteraceae bacterium]|nr:MFS transporter [Bryobacteraceae bacterium]